MASLNQRRPMDAPLDGPVHDEKPTGLLTRFIPARLQHSKFYGLLLRLTRVLQFLSSVISLGIFSQRLFKVYRLVNSIKTRRGVNGSYGAVEGILAAAVLYTLIMTILGCIKKNSSPGTKTWLRWLWVVLDILFVGAFIAVAVITSPNGGMAGPRHCYSEGRLSDGSNSATGETASTDDTCDLPWGTFIWEHRRVHQQHGTCCKQHSLLVIPSFSTMHSSCSAHELDEFCSCVVSDGIKPKIIYDWIFEDCLQGRKSSNISSSKDTYKTASLINKSTL